ncbi:DUF2927 domain-containing protein [Maritalea sp.]|uniref:DUF2927 domain-containing protein n=1 Tax=Maritalea sp. TaxID=2003361 RepID=UPI003EF4E04F
MSREFSIQILTKIVGATISSGLGVLTQAIFVVWLCILPITTCLAQQPITEPLQKALNIYDEETLIDYYIKSAFQLEFADNEEAVGRDKLYKRVKQRVLHVLPLFLDPKSYTDKEFEFDVIFRVVHDINAHLPFEIYKAYRPSQLIDAFGTRKNLKIAQHDRAYVVIGSSEEIDSYMDDFGQKGETGQIAFQLYQIAKNAPDMKQGVCTATPFPALIEDVNSVGTVFILIDDERNLEACLYEELIQSLGLLGDFSPGTESMFNDDDVHKTPTTLDWALLQIHMDAKVVAGIGPSEIRMVAAKIIEDIKVNIPVLAGVTTSEF